jgi:DNA-binding PadR family transcriptional regulator
VARWIRETTDDALQIEEGALYTALHRLEKKGWIESNWGLSENNRQAKFYGLTPDGVKQLGKGSRAWARYAEAVSKVLGTPDVEVAT